MNAIVDDSLVTDRARQVSGSVLGPEAGANDGDRAAHKRFQRRRHPRNALTRPIRRLALLGAATALALALSGFGSAASTPKAVTGTVGPGFTIGLELGGRKVTKLKAGVPYRFVIRDRSSIHDFHLRGRSLNRVLSGVAYTGTRSVLLTLKKGTYRFMCDPHADSMHGSFRVD